MTTFELSITIMLFTAICAWINKQANTAMIKALTYISVFISIVFLLVIVCVEFYNWVLR